MSNVFVIIKMCYMHNQWYDISCVTLYNTAWLLLMMSVNSSYNYVLIYMLRNWNLSCIWNDSSVLFLFLPFPFLLLFASCHPTLSLLQQPVRLQNPAATGKNTAVSIQWRQTCLSMISDFCHKVAQNCVLLCYQVTTITAQFLDML